MLPDVVRMVPYVRDADRDEIRAATGGSITSALVQGLQESDQCYTVVYQGEPAAMFGIATVTTPDGMVLGAVWLIGTNAIGKFKRLFARESKTWVERLSKGYQVIGNVVDERNEAHVRWLKWLGFTFINRIEKYGHERRPFLEFVKLCATPQQ